jgi:HK97 gp10 family phage protein
MPRSGGTHSRYDGFDATQFLRDLKQFAREVDDALPRAVAEASAIVAEEIRSRCPVDSGHLRDSIEILPLLIEDGRYVQGVQVGEQRPADGRWYVGFVEYGAHGHTGTPFIRPAIRAAEARVVRAIESALREH